MECRVVSVANSASRSLAIDPGLEVPVNVGIQPEHSYSKSLVMSHPCIL